MYSNLRFVISASVVGCAGLIGVLALLPATLEDRLLASAELSAPAARPCKQQNWLNLDRNCLTRRGMPWVAARPAPDAAQASSSPETSADQALTETPSSAAVAEEAEKPGEVTASRQETPIVEGAGTTTQTSEAVPPPQHEPTLPQQAVITPPREPVTPQHDVAAPQPDPVSPKQQAAAPQPEQAAPQQKAAAPQPEQVGPQQEAAAPQREQVGPQQQAVAPQPEPPAPQQEASAPAVPEEPQHATKRRSVTPVRHVAPAAPPISEKRRAAKANVEPQPRATAGKTAARESRGAKPANEAVETQPRAPGAKTAARENRGAKPANEALNAVRRFQDNLRDIPVSSYTADGTARTIVIRPTSIQDVYYYSAPR
ncbi:MAG TPA: hypothetical protein VFI58_21825 [Xanthobacteraceae bacterium]|nr:hypothetical protein [Xanthobacteraceae bacterium]